MKVGTWIAGLYATVFAEGVALVVLAATTSAENCEGARNAPWQCSEFLREGSEVALYVIPALYVGALVGVATRNRLRRHA